MYPDPWGLLWSLAAYREYSQDDLHAVVSQRHGSAEESEDYTAFYLTSKAVSQLGHAVVNC